MRWSVLSWKPCGDNLDTQARFKTAATYCVYYLVVVVLVPIAFRVPAALVFIPPPMTLPPATLPRIVQFTTLVICQPAVWPVSPDCLVEFMFCVSDPALTSVEGFCLKARHCGAKQKRSKND
jgi:hypothetical protein